MSAYLNRQTSGFADELWARIDTAAVEAARELITARRILDVDGPYGPGLTSVEVGDESTMQAADDDKASAVASRAIALPMLRQPFALSIRRVEGHQRKGLPLDLRPVEDAAEAVARREEEIIYYGLEEAGIAGLLTADGRHQLECGDWKQVDEAVNDIIRAVTRLDDSGFRGPYALALSPSRYNALFRRYEGSDLLQLDHLRRLCAVGVFKAPIEGAAVVDPRVGAIKVGQDLRVGFGANDGIHFRLFASESLVLLLDSPEAVCTLGP